MKINYYKMPNGSDKKYIVSAKHKVIIIDISICLERKKHRTIKGKINIENVKIENIPMNLLLGYFLNYKIFITDGDNFKLLGMQLPENYLDFAIKNYQEIFKYISENYTEIKEYYK